MMRSNIILQPKGAIQNKYIILYLAWKRNHNLPFCPLSEARKPEGIIHL